MKQLQTAEEFLLKEHHELLESIIDGEQSFDFGKSFIEEWLIEFAKLHVQAALESAAENAIAKEDPYGTGEIWVDEDSILNAYPLYNIK